LAEIYDGVVNSVAENNRLFSKILAHLCMEAAASSRAAWPFFKMMRSARKPNKKGSVNEPASIAGEGFEPPTFGDQTSSISPVDILTIGQEKRCWFCL